MNRNQLVETAHILVKHLKTLGLDESVYSELSKQIELNEFAKEQYEQVVAEAAEAIVCSLDVEEEEDIDEQLRGLFHNMSNEHPWVLNQDYAIVILQYSENPTAELFNNGAADEYENGKAEFPFCVCAAAALEEDVKQYLNGFYGFDGPITATMVKKAQQQVKDAS